MAGRRARLRRDDRDARAEKRGLETVGRIERDFPPEPFEPAVRDVVDLQSHERVLPIEKIEVRIASGRCSTGRNVRRRS